MSGINLDEMNDIQYDVLKELGNIGAGHATTALTLMLGTRIDMMVPSVQLVELSEVSGIIGDEEELMAGILLLLEGDISGMMMFILDFKSAKGLVNRIMNMEDTGDGSSFSEMELSALNEVGNIITGAYLCALSDLTKLQIIPSVPSISVDMAASMLSIPAIEFGKIGDKVLFIETKFDQDAAIDGYFIFIPEQESYGKILNSLGL